MEVIPTDPRTLDPLRTESAPVHHYHVVFWRQAVASGGFPQSATIWAAHENEVLDVVDVQELLAWADDEAQKRGAAYAVYAVVEVFVPSGPQVFDVAVTEFHRREIAVWLGGINPTLAGENFTQLLPRGAQPTWGDPKELYRPKRD